MINESGSISIHTENIFPIIKKWLYSDKDIFIRELVSNSSDAISKYVKLKAMGEIESSEDEKYTIRVAVNKDQKTLKFMDNGIGMTAEEVKKYINQIAFSGAQDFIEKYKEKGGEGSQIIGHFGLGFYSSFMVSDKVQIDTLSWQKDSEPVRWTSAGGTEYELDISDRAERGTTVTLYLSEDSVEFLDTFKVREVLEKYCAFMPYEIYVEDEAKKEEKETENKPVNDTHPLWLKNPKDCTDEEYKDFYKKVFMDFNDPLFWIHLNMDYPFNLKGILYFPKLKHEFETMEGRIKLFYNQVFVADNIKEVIPEFLMLLRGVLDCPDLPLNVSRSFLQNDGYVSKISTHITKKVADKLTSLYENDKESYQKYWDDISPFVKYGCMREPKFYDRAKDIVLYKTTSDDYVTLKDYLDRNKEKHENKVFYVSDEKQQAQYIKLFKDHGLEAVVFKSMIDSHFMQFLEMKETAVKFSRIDSDLSENLKDKESSDSEALKEMQSAFEGLFREVTGDNQLKVQVEALKSSELPGVMLLSEQSRRMAEMSAYFGGGGMGNMFPEERTLVLNGSSNLIKTLYSMKDDKQRVEDRTMICQQVYDLALMSHKQLEPDAMSRFMERSAQLLERLATR